MVKIVDNTDSTIQQLNIAPWCNLNSLENTV